VKRAAKGFGKDMLGAAGEIIHEGLNLGAAAVELVPVPGLQEAVGLLLAIWGSCEIVEVSPSVAVFFNLSLLRLQ